MSHRAPEWWCSTAEVKTSLRELTIRSGRAASLTQALKAILDLGTTLVLARLLLPSDFGLVSMVFALTGFVALFDELGLATVTVQREDLTPRDVSALFWLNTLFGAALTVILFFAAPFVALYYQKPELTPITRVLGCSFLLTGVTVQHRALLRRRMLNVRLAVVDLCQMIAGIVVAIWLAIDGAGPWAIALRSPLSCVVGIVATFLACNFRPGSPFQSTKIRTLMGTGAGLTGFSVINYVARNVDNVLIGRYVGPFALGLYSKAYDLLLLPLRQIGEPAGAVAIPSLSRVAGEPERYRQAFLRILEKVLLLSLPLGAILMASSDAVVRLVLGPRWSGAGPIFFWLGWLTFTQPIGNAAGWIFVSQGRTGELLRWGLIGSGLSVASFVVGIRWGALGVAAAYSLSGVALRTPIVLWMLGQKGPVRTRDVLKTSAPITAAALLGLGVSLLLRHAVGEIHPVLVVLMSTASCLGVTLAVLLPLASGRRALADLVLIASFRRRLPA